ncbi:MAG: hypothetical protein O2910_04785, partial [Proteobacteria bacterium]|nr:hypothetical protein [Pseudomonadota bacterium]
MTRRLSKYLNRLFRTMAFASLCLTLVASCASDEKSAPTAKPAPSPATQKELSREDQAALESRAMAIHDRVITIDTHIDIPPNYTTRAADPGDRGPMQVDIPKMIEGGLDAG